MRVCLCFTPHPHPTPCNAFCLSSQMLWPKAILEASRQAFQNSKVARGEAVRMGCQGVGVGRTLRRKLLLSSSFFFFSFLLLLPQLLREEPG